MALGGMTAAMDQLVAGARSLRDATFNTLDAVERRTKTASEEVASRVAPLIAERLRSTQQDTLAAARDDRFDPEDEWEVSGPPSAPGGTGGAGTTPGTSSRRDDDGVHGADRGAHGSAHGSADREEDQDDYPESWLR